MKKIQLILNIIAYTALFGYVIWMGIIWWQNPGWSQIQVFQQTWYGIFIAFLLALPAIAYDVYSKWDK
jgi:hypothetical protein